MFVYKRLIQCIVSLELFQIKIHIRMHDVDLSREIFRYQNFKMFFRSCKHEMGVLGERVML